MQRCARLSRRAVLVKDLCNKQLRNSISSRAVCCSYQQYHGVRTRFEVHKSNLNAYLFEPLFRAYSSGNLPEHVRVTLPALSPTMEKGTIVRWAKQEGDRVAEGDLLAEIETDKATMGLENSDEGYIAKILLPGGSKDIPIGSLACIIVRNKADVGAFANFDASSAPAPAKSSPSTPPSQSQPVPPASKASNSGSASQQQYPKHLLVAMPGLSPTMTKGNIKDWLKKEGDSVKEGDVLVQIETDKATMDFETPEEGFLAKIIQSSGSKDVDIGKPLCVLVFDQSHVSSFKSYTAPSSQEQPQQQSAQAESPSGRSAPSAQSSQASQPPAAAAAASSAGASGGRVPATPMAKRVAQEKGLNLQLLAGKGTGMLGEVTARDVMAFDMSSVSAASSASVAPSSHFSDIDLSNMRKVIAKRLLQSKTTIPHYYLTIDVNMDKAQKARQDLNGLVEKDKVKLSLNDFIIKAAALACTRVPEANSSWQETFIRRYHNVDISVAVATDAGLITPIVFQAERKGLVTINREVATLAQKAREGKLQPHEFQGGTFTISNLGMFGVKNFAAVINPPQSCILAVGRTDKRLVADANSTAGSRPGDVMTVTLSCDHRVVDGAVGAQWLAEFRKFLERPETMLL